MKLNKIAASTALAVTVGLSGAFAQTVVFTTWADDQNSYLIQQDGFDFTLNIVASGGAINAPASGNTFGIGNTNISNGESLTFTLTALETGANTLDTISFRSLSFNSWERNSNTNYSSINLTQGAAAPVLYSGSSDQGNENSTVLESEIPGTFAPLTIVNVGGEGDGSWSLGFVENGTSSFTVNNIQFDYTFTVVPEPSSAGLLAGIFAMGYLMLRRRRA